MSGGNERKKYQRGSPKEKVLSIYDKLFLGQDITQGQAAFWHGFFLLKTNLKGLLNHFEKSTLEDLHRLKPQLNRLLMQCLQTASTEKNRIRFENAIQTMDFLINGIYRCKSGPESLADVNKLLLNEYQMKDFLQHYTMICTDVFCEERTERLRALVLKSMCMFATASPEIATSPFSSGLMNERIFDLLRLILVSPQLRYHHGITTCRILGLLMEYGAHDRRTGHPFMQHFAFTEDNAFLTGMSSTVSHALSKYNLRFHEHDDLSTSGLLTSMSSFIGSIFAGDVASNISLRPCDSLLLCIYTVTKTSVHFSSLLSYSHAHGSSLNGIVESVSSSLHSSGGDGTAYDGLTVMRGDTLTSPTITNNHWNMAPGCAVDMSKENGHRRGDKCVSNVGSRHLYRTAEGQFTQPDLLTTSQSVCCEPPVENGIFAEKDLNEVDFSASDSSSSTPILEPRNLLADLLEYCSIVMQDVKAQDSLHTCHLCLIIILRITQNPLASSILHDHHVTYKVRIHKQCSRYQKLDSSMYTNCSNRPIVVAIMTLLVEFLRGHLMKKLPYRPYMITLSIFRNLLCYQKKHKIRLDFEWKHLWSALISLLQFVLKLCSTGAIHLTVAFRLMQKILEVFNFFILFGDHFLQAADIYDDLYYELIRMHNLFERVYEYSLTHSTGSNPEVKVVASHVVLYIGNVRSIVNHFQAQIASFLASNNMASPTENQVLHVVRENYNSLTLRYHENLDTYESHIVWDDQSLFTNLLDTLIKQVRKDSVDLSLEFQARFHELSTAY